MHQARPSEALIQCARHHLKASVSLLTGLFGEVLHYSAWAYWEETCVPRLLDAAATLPKSQYINSTRKYAAPLRDESSFQTLHRSTFAHMTESELFLWDHPVSPFSQKVRIALREKNIPFHLATPRGTGSGIAANFDNDFADRNHRLEVPTLVVNKSLKIFESTIILEFIEDAYPDRTPLRAPDAVGRARARMIEDVCDSQYEAVNWGLGELTTFRRGEGKPELVEELKAKAAAHIAEIQGWLTQQLGEALWFGGEEFGYADVCVWPYVNRSSSYGLEPKPGTLLGDWYERAKQRSSVRSVFEEFQANTKNMSAAYEVLQKGLMKREYRDHRLEWMIKAGGMEIVKDGIEKDNIRFQWPS
jgi:glutathione S-transferase